MITPKGSCEPNNDENLQRSDWRRRCIGHGHDCFHMECWSLSLACSFISLLRYLALFADRINLHCSGCLNPAASKLGAPIDSPFVLPVLVLSASYLHYSTFHTELQCLITSRLTALGGALKSEGFPFNHLRTPTAYQCCPEMAFPYKLLRKRPFHASC